MYSDVAWAQVSSGIQVQLQIILDPYYLSEYLSVSYDYEKTIQLYLSPQYKLDPRNCKVTKVGLIPKGLILLIIT